MRLRRLGWAGIELEAEGESLVIDHMLDPGVLRHFFGPERDELIAPEAGRATAALVTHLHLDHTDADAIAGALTPGATVYRPPRARAMSKLDEAATGDAERALDALAHPLRECVPGDRHEVGPFTIAALSASDGLGSPQVSWLVEAGDRRVLHGGDTIWHGGWWEIALTHGPIDVACLPGNGVDASYPGWEPAADVPIVMTPEQTVEAAHALGAATLAPIHYNRTFEHPDFYRPVADAEQRIRNRAAERGVTVDFLAPGAWIEVGSRQVAG
jgi:L-ascorbate metabolism protein UlaG (beta-lactamase superfamily)